MLGPERAETVLPDRALFLPTFSHLLNVNKISLALSLSLSCAGCRLGGFPVGHDWWGGERVVGGVLPRIGIGDGVCVTVYV